MVPSHVFDYYSCQPHQDCQQSSCYAMKESTFKKELVASLLRKTGEPLFQELARCHVEAMEVMEGRKPGSISTLGYLGALASALFTAYAVQGLPLELWGSGLLKTLPLALEYVQAVGVESEASVGAWTYFQQWYLSERGLADGRGPVQFPSVYGPTECDDIYKTFSRGGWAGLGRAVMTPMVAYDALLGAGNSWEKLCRWAIFHGGDGDSTGLITASWGLAYGLRGVPDGNHVELDYRDRMVSVADSLYRLAWEQVPA